MKTIKTRFSLKKKLVLLIVPIIVLVTLVAGFFSYRSLHDITRTMYTSKSMELSAMTASLCDPHKVKTIRDAVMAIYNTLPEKISNEDWESPEYEAYLENYQAITETDEYKDIQRQLRLVQDNNNLQASYLVWFDVPTGTTVYLVDGAYEDICQPGSFDAIMYPVDYEAMKNPEKGIAPDVTNTEGYGWVVVAGSPVFCEGELVAFAAAELSMNKVMAQQNRFFLIEFAALLGMTVIFIIASILLIDKMLIRPINKLSSMSEKYWSGETSAIRHEFSKLEIHTGDELEMLSNSMKQMEQNINEHIVRILNTTNELIETRKRAEEMDRAANIDALTRVRNKRAYDVEIERLNKEITEGKTAFGIAMIDLNFLKKINDTYGHDKGDAAIRALCQTICRVFAHSSVYRVGGDEFIVVLENHDYEMLGSRKEAFEQEMKRLGEGKAPEEILSAAAGYAVFDPALDRDAESVFKRADQNMYERKKQMKADRP